MSFWTRLRNVFTKEVDFALQDVEHELANVRMDVDAEYVKLRTETNAIVAASRARLAQAVKDASPEVKAAVDSELAVVLAKILTALA